MRANIQYILLYYVVINIISFTIMYIDKQRAIQHKYRISEKSLWTVAWIGGAAGCTFGMKRFRHKTKHTLFRIGFPFLFIVQVCLLVWFITFKWPQL